MGQSLREGIFVMSDQNEYKSIFFIVPARIMNLPGLTLAFLRFYETIYQFWNAEKPCYLNNDSLKERTGIASSSTIQEAFEFFEAANEMKRIYKGKRRYLIQPERKIEIEVVDNSPKSLSKIDQPLAVASPTSRCTERLPLATARHKNNKFNNKNLRESNARKKHVPLPDDFKPNGEAIEFAKNKGIDLIKVFNKFKRRVKADGWKRIDWHEALMEWLESEHIDSPITGAGIVKTIPRQENIQRCTLDWFNDNH
jgi:hypothetical protein